MKIKIMNFCMLITFATLAITSHSLLAKEASIEFLGSNGGSPSIDLVFEGEVYDAENTYALIAERVENGQSSAVENFLLSFLEASKIPDREKILQHWEKSSHQRIGEMMDDPEMWNLNKNLFQSIEKSILMATMEMGQYTLAYVAHQYSNSDRLSEKVYPIKKINGELFMTNDLRDNSFFFRFSDLIADHLSQEVLELED